MKEDFELLRYVTIGQYLPGHSFVHRLDPAVKLLITAILVLSVAFLYSYVAIAITFLAILGIVAVAGVPLGFALSGLRPAFWFIVALLLLELLFSPASGMTGGTTLLSWRFIHITTGSLHLTLVSAARLVAFILLISAYTLTTRTTDVTRALERLLGPLQVLRVPSRELALVMTIALRFVPTFALETEKLMKAQASRGGGLTGVGTWNFVGQLRARLPLIVPLFLSALRRGEDLVVAMESRCYVPGRERTMFRQYRISGRDWAALALAVLFAVLLFAAPFPA